MSMVSAYEPQPPLKGPLRATPTRAPAPKAGAAAVGSTLFSVACWEGKVPATAVAADADADAAAAEIELPPPPPLSAGAC